MKGMGDKVEKPLTPKMEAFCLAYLTEDTASDAYRKAYPASQTWKPDSVWQSASRLLADPKVSARVAELRKKAESSKVLELRDALEILSAIVTANVEDFMDPTTGKIDIRRGNARAVEAVSITELKGGVRVTKFKLASKLGALQKLADILGWDAPKKFQPGDGVVFNLNLAGEKPHE